MRKYRNVFLVMIVIITFFSLFVGVEEDGAKSIYDTNTDEANLAQVSANSPAIMQNTSKNQLEVNTAMQRNRDLERTYIVIAILFILWGLCIYLAMRLNILFRQTKKETRISSESVKI